MGTKKNSHLKGDCLGAENDRLTVFHIVLIINAL